MVGHHTKAAVSICWWCQSIHLVPSAYQIPGCWGSNPSKNILQLLQGNPEKFIGQSRILGQLRVKRHKTIVSHIIQTRIDLDEFEDVVQIKYLHSSQYPPYSFINWKHMTFRVDGSVIDLPEHVSYNFPISSHLNTVINGVAFDLQMLRWWLKVTTCEKKDPSLADLMVKLCRMALVLVTHHFQTSIYEGF